MAKNSPPPGTSDIFPSDIHAWQELEQSANEVFSLYGYEELRTPVFEYTEVFKRGLGDDTEVVQKEMYTFEDRGGRSLTLRPEGTAGVMRAMLGTDVMNGNEQRVFYIGPMFRGEKPAAGRKRQFHQIGVENIGRKSPLLDAESIAMLIQYLEEIGINDSELLINTRGAQSDRKPAEDALKAYFSEHIDTMCDDCKTRLENNVWRILDCKSRDCQSSIDSAPDPSSYFSDESKDYFKKVIDALDALDIKYKIDTRLVRGLDYYVHTVFELVHSGLGAQNAIAGGGRYELFLPGSKKPVIGVGYAMGMERLLMVRESLNIETKLKSIKPIYLVGLGEPAIMRNIKLAALLRIKSLPVISEVEQKSMKAQMRTANRISATYAIISGDDEVANKNFVCKNMETGEQSEFSEDKLIDFLTNKYEEEK